LFDLNAVATLITTFKSGSDICMAIDHSRLRISAVSSRGIITTRLGTDHQHGVIHYKYVIGISVRKYTRYRPRMNEVLYKYVYLQQQLG